MIGTSRLWAPIALLLLGNSVITHAEDSPPKHQSPKPGEKPKNFDVQFPPACRLEPIPNRLSTHLGARINLDANSLKVISRMTRDEVPVLGNLITLPLQPFAMLGLGRLMTGSDEARIFGELELSDFEKDTQNHSFRRPKKLHIKLVVEGKVEKIMGHRADFFSPTHRALYNGAQRDLPPNGSKALDTLVDQRAVALAGEIETKHTRLADRVREDYVERRLSGLAVDEALKKQDGSAPPAALEHLLMRKNPRLLAAQAELMKKVEQSQLNVAKRLEATSADIKNEPAGWQRNVGEKLIEFAAVATQFSETLSQDPSTQPWMTKKLYEAYRSGRLKEVQDAWSTAAEGDPAPTPIDLTSEMEKIDRILDDEWRKGLTELDAIHKKELKEQNLLLNALRERVRADPAITFDPKALAADPSANNLNAILTSSFSIRRGIGGLIDTLEFDTPHKLGTYKGRKVSDTSFLPIGYEGQEASPLTIDTFLDFAQDEIYETRLEEWNAKKARKEIREYSPVQSARSFHLQPQHWVERRGSHWLPVVPPGKEPPLWVRSTVDLTFEVNDKNEFVLSQLDENLSLSELVRKSSGDQPTPAGMTSFDNKHYLRPIDAAPIEAAYQAKLGLGPNSPSFLKRSLPAHGRFGMKIGPSINMGRVYMDALVERFSEQFLILSEEHPQLAKLERMPIAEVPGGYLNFARDPRIGSIDEQTAENARVRDWFHDLQACRASGSDGLRCQNQLNDLVKQANHLRGFYEGGKKRLDDFLIELGKTLRTKDTDDERGRVLGELLVANRELLPPSWKGTGPDALTLSCVRHILDIFGLSDGFRESLKEASKGPTPMAPIK